MQSNIQSILSFYSELTHLLFKNNCFNSLGNIFRTKFRLSVSQIYDSNNKTLSWSHLSWYLNRFCQWPECISDGIAFNQQTWGDADDWTESNWTANAKLIRVVLHKNIDCIKWWHEFVHSGVINGHIVHKPESDSYRDRALISDAVLLHLRW